MVEALRRGWNVLAHAGSAAQKVPEFVVATAISFGRRDALEAEHWSTSPLDAAVILLQTIIEVLIGSVPHARTKLCPDCPRIGIVAVCRDSIRDHSGDRLCRSKEARGRGEVAVLTELTSTRAPSRSIAR
jgi:hypothetical protein